MSVVTFFQGVGQRWQAGLRRPLKRNPGIAADNKPGQVFLVGAGPGDPELLTVKALRLLQSADVALYDALVSAELLKLIPRTTGRMFVGKRAGRHSLTQPEICRLLVEQASMGKTVVRLKGGDPGIFGRVVEEAQSLTDAGIPFAIVPGVTSACAASAYSGIPLTCRGVAQQVSFVTAQFADPQKQPDWQHHQSAAEGQTLVFYMGLGKLHDMTAGLQQAGWPADTPVALLDQVSTRQQKVITGTLSSIVSDPAVATLRGPTLTLVGEVVHQRMAVDWQLLEVAATLV